MGSITVLRISVRMGRREDTEREVRGANIKAQGTRLKASKT